MSPVFVNDKLNPQAFDPALWDSTHEMNDALMAAADSQSPLLGTTHFLITLMRVPGGLAAKAVLDKGIGQREWESGLRACIDPVRGALPPAHLLRSSLDAEALIMFAEAQKLCVAIGRDRMDDLILLLCSLRHAEPNVRQLLQDAGIDATEWCRGLEEQLQPTRPLDLFNENSGEVRSEMLSTRTRKVLSVMRDEAQSMGYESIDPRHLLLALLTQQGGATQYALHKTGASPRRVHESVTLALRARSSIRRSTIPLDREHMQPALRRILLKAGELAVRERASKVAEVHLLRALLGAETAARGILEDEELSPQKLAESISHWSAAEELADTESNVDEIAIADIDTVRRRIEERLVGQEQAIQSILPYVQRMRFGFSLPGRPLGVFLFCGPSGVGKTEMAKELARAVFGSDESLIFLEMGQFNSKESMNIFIGAPPGYIGYGEGKLTNGLRDKPRSVVLFDEVEKANPLVLDALLRFLDEGRIDDPAGAVRDGSGCIVVLTSNVGSVSLAKSWRQFEGEANWKARMRQELREVFRRRKFRPEFLNRVDELVFFRPLAEEHYTEIARRALVNNLRRLSEERKIDVTLDGVYELIGKYCATIDEGARAAHRLTLSMVVTPVIDYVVRNQLAPPMRLRVRAIRESGDASCEPRGVVEKLPS